MTCVKSCGGIEVHVKYKARRQLGCDGSIEVSVGRDIDAVAVVIEVPKTWTTCAPRGFDMASEVGKGGIGERKAPRVVATLDFERCFRHFVCSVSLNDRFGA